VRNSKVRSILAPSPNRLLRYYDLMAEYGMTQDAAYEVLHRHGIKLGGGMYITRTVLERVLEGRPAQ
jgi:hypothetical protein